MQKFAVVLLVCLCMASGAMATDVPGRFIEWLVRFFEISRPQAENCVRKTGVTSENLQEFTRGLGEDYFSEGARKVACVLSCACEMNGVLINGKVQVKKLHDLVTRTGNTAPEDVMQKAHETIDSCLNAIDETDECDLALKFANCVVKEFER